MGRTGRQRLGFKTRVLVPVVVILLVLFGATLWMINVRVAEAVRRQASDNLDVVASVFENFQELRGRDLLLRARNIQSDPRFKALAQVGDTKTMSVLLADLLEELNLQLVAFFDTDGRLQARAGLSAPQADDAIRERIAETMRGGLPQDFLVAEGRLFEIATVPVSIGGSMPGIMMIGQEIGARAAGDFRLLTGCEEILYDGGEIIVSTLRDEADLAVIREVIAQPRPAGQVRIGRRLHLLRGGELGPRNLPPRCRYLLLASMEPALRELRAMQSVVLVVGVFGLVASVAVVRFVLIRATGPLDALQEGAEQIGRGDFSHRVEVDSKDEFGDLARAFNEMAGRLKASHESLEASVAKLRETRARLLQSEKLSALGEFISGVAHELNNPLTVMIGFARMLQESDLPPARRDEVRQIAEAAERCQKIVGNLLSFSRQRPPERRPADLNEILEGTARFLQYELRTSNVEIVLRPDPGLPRVLGDTHQLQQVFLNLINNARQAIEETGRKGSIRVTTCTAGDAVRAIIEDDGPGIAPECLNRIFDPFFTTKPAGKGTGLGLSVSYGIVKEHGGDIRADARPGGGATFVVDLPATDRQAPVPAPAEIPPALLEGGAMKRVLIVDDEAALLLLAARMLARNNCICETAPDGLSALDAIRRGAFDAVCCDWKMPGLAGPELFARIRELAPQLTRSLVVMSGDVLNEQILEFAKEQDLLLLAKPFSMPELCRAVAEAVARGRPEPAGPAGAGPAEAGAA